MTETLPKGPRPAASLARKVASAAGWNFLATLSERLVAFGVFVLVVRHIAPAQIGVVTLASIFIDMSLIMTEGGLYDTLIRHPSPTERTYNTAFWANLGLGLIMTAVVAVLAYPISAFYHSHSLLTVMDALSLAFVISAVGFVPLARLARDFGFKAMAYRSMAATVAGGLAALYLSINDFGIWALVAQRLVTVLISTILLCVAARWRPRFQFSYTEFREMFWFGLKVTGSTLCHQLTGSIVLMIMGVFCGNAAVGFYRVAQRLFDVVTQFMIVPVLKVALSSFITVRDDPSMFASTYVRMTGAVAFGGIVVFFGLGALATPTITLVFGPDWQPSGSILTIMALSSIPMCCTTFLWPALTAGGRPGALQTYGIAEVAVAGMFTIAAAPFGVNAIASAQVLRSIAMLPYSFYLLSSIVTVRARAIIAELLVPAVAALFMAAVLWLLATRQALDMAPAKILSVDIPLGIAIYGLVLMIIAPTRMAKLWEQLRHRLRPRTTSIS